MQTLLITDTKRGERKYPIVSTAQAKRLVSGMSRSGKGTILETGQEIDMSFTLCANPLPSALSGRK